MMKIFGKPENKWGWVRITGCSVLAGVVVWTLLAAALRSFGEVPWMVWSGYQTHSLLDGFEFAIIPLLSIIAAGWLEEENLKTKTRQSTERAVAAHRREIIKCFHETVLAVLSDRVQVSLRISEIVQASLPELDGKGKGEVLHFLFEKGLLTGEKPVVELNGMDFSEVKIEKVHFNGICLENVNLTNGQMDGAHLVKCQLSGANLSRAFLRHTDLREAALRGNNLYGARLEGANMEGADLRGANLESAFFMNANLKHCLLDNTSSGEVDFGGGLKPLEQSILIETILPDGRKVTNDKGKEYLRNKELAILVDKL